MSGLTKAQKAVDEIVARMVSKGYPVEATHKSGHRPDYLPCDAFGGWKDEVCKWTGNTYAEDNFARVLVGGWFSKSALTQLVVEVRRAALSVDPPQEQG